jgi:hypothetical protein
LGIELGEQLAALAVKNCQAYPGVKILHSTFEDWEIEEKAFDLTLAADSFHWIPPEVGYPKASRALKDTGSAAFFWLAPVDPQTDWSRAIEILYQETAPQFVIPEKRFTSDWLIGIVKKNFEASECFGEVTTQRYYWSEDLTGEAYIKGLRTFSMHHGIDEEVRERLYAGILDVINQFGGAITLPNSVVLFHAKVKR